MSQSFYSLSNIMLHGKNLLKVFVVGLGISNAANASIPNVDAGHIAQLVMQYGQNELMQTLTENSFNTQHNDMSKLKDIFGATSGGLGSIGSVGGVVSTVGGMVGGTGVMNILNASQATHDDVTKGSQAAKDGVNKKELKTPAWVDDEVLNSDFLKGTVENGVYGRTGGNMGQVYNEIKDSLGDCDHIVNNANLASNALSGAAALGDGKVFKMNISDKNSAAKAKCEEEISSIVVERFLIKNAARKIRESQKALNDIYAQKIGKESTAKAAQDVVASIEVIRARLKLEMAEYRNLMDRVKNRNRLEVQRAQMGKQIGQK